MTAAEVWDHVDVRGPSECWEWKGARHIRGGYGVARIDGVIHRVSRWVLTQREGPLDRLTLACHTCDNPPCCNPAHIVPGTHSDNGRDAFARGLARPVRGADNPNTKLTPEAVGEIREALGASRPVKAIAREHGVDGKTIRSIRDGRTWRWA